MIESDLVLGPLVFRLLSFLDLVFQTQTIGSSVKLSHFWTSRSLPDIKSKYEIKLYKLVKKTWFILYNCSN